MTLPVAVAGPSAYWYLTRGTGTVALVLLTVTVVLGVLDVERFASPRWPRFAVDRVHRDASLLVIALLVVHIVTSVLDAFAPIRLLDGVIPFVSAYRPLWLGLGALAFDVLLAVLLTSLVRRRIGHRGWRVVHWLAYLTWPAAVFHTLGTGSDASSLWLSVVTGACLLAVLLAVGSRIVRTGRGPALVRGGAAVAAVALPVGIVVFALAGPFAPHWARRAGTPTTLLRAAAVQRASAPRRVVRTVPPVHLTRDHVPRTFTDSLDGTVRQSPATGGAIVDLVMRCEGALSGTLRVRLAGAPVAGGGLSLTGSQVQLTASGLTAALQGRVRSLAGQSFDARVRNAVGTTVDLRVDLNIDAGSGTVTGTLVGDRA
jgi:hypothetical protein